MVIQKKRRKDEIDKNYPRRQLIKKLRRLADCIEQGRRFQIQLDGERISIPATAFIKIEYERDTESQEVDFQIKWPLDQ